MKAEHRDGPPAFPLSDSLPLSLSFLLALPLAFLLFLHLPLSGLHLFFVALLSSPCAHALLFLRHSLLQITEQIVYEELRDTSPTEL